MHNTSLRPDQIDFKVDGFFGPKSDPPDRNYYFSFCPLKFPMEFNELVAAGEGSDVNTKYICLKRGFHTQYYSYMPLFDIPRFQNNSEPQIMTKMSNF